LGLLFVSFQAFEYHEAYTEMGLTLGSGIYGSTFFMLTGFHADTEVHHAYGKNRAEQPGKGALRI